MSNKKFRSILSDPKYLVVSSYNTSYSEDYHISDASAESEQENKEHDLTIEWSDEDTGQQLSASFQATTTAKKYTHTTSSGKRVRRRRTPKSLHNIKVRRKLDSDNKSIKRDILQSRHANASQTASACGLEKLELETADQSENVDFDECFIECPSTDDESWLEATENTQSIENPKATASQAADELDLLLELIQRECSNTKPSVASKRKGLRSRNGGYLQYLEKTLAKARTDRRFLEHDKKMHLEMGIVFKVMELKASFGVHMATLYNASIQSNICAILPPELVGYVEIGSELEAFFDESIAPYKLSVDENNATATQWVYVQPNKLLLL